MEYWTTKDGTRVDIDKMSVEHLRNTLKMIVRNRRESIKELTSVPLEGNEVYTDYLRMTNK